MKNFGLTQSENADHKVWPQIITLLLGLSTSIYVVWSQSNSWFWLVPGILTVLSVTLLARDSGLFGWCQRLLRKISANRIAKQEYLRFKKFIRDARIYSELERHLRANVEWIGDDPGRIPSFVNISFNNWYSDIYYAAEQLHIKSVSELELIGSRFRDFLDVLNMYFLAPYAYSLQGGKAKYRTEQGLKDVRQAKERYERFLGAYREFCEELESKAQRRILTAVHYDLPHFDWSVAAPISSTTKAQ